MPNQNTVQGTQRPASQEPPQPKEQRMKITFKRLREPMPQDDTSEATIDVPCRCRCRSQHTHVNTVPNPTDSDEEIHTTLPSHRHHGKVSLSLRARLLLEARPYSQERGRCLLRKWSRSHVPRGPPVARAPSTRNLSARPHPHIPSSTDTKCSSKETSLL